MCERVCETVRWAPASGFAVLSACLSLVLARAPYEEAMPSGLVFCRYVLLRRSNSYSYSYSEQWANVQPD